MIYSLRVTCQTPYTYLLECAVSAFSKGGYPPSACAPTQIRRKGQMCVLRAKDPDNRIGEPEVSDSKGRASLV